MFEYQISIAHNGKFLFRTDVMNEDYYQSCAVYIVRKFPASEGYTVRVSCRSATSRSKDISQ